MKKNKILREAGRIRLAVDSDTETRLQRLREAKENKDFRQMIHQWSEEKLSSTSKILSDKQRMAIYLMTDFVHNFSYKYISTRLGIDPSVLTKWRNDPLFLRELDKEITRRRSFIRIHAFRNIHRAIMRGSMKDTWNYLKMSGDLKENVNIVDHTGERELDDNELTQEIVRLTKQLEATTKASEN